MQKILKNTNNLHSVANYYKQDGDEKLYLKYINNSSMPYVLKLNDQDEVDKYLDSIYNTIIVKDLM